MRVLLSAAIILFLAPAAAEGSKVYRCPGEDGIEIFTNLFDHPDCVLVVDDEPPPRPVGDERSKPYEKVIAIAADKYGVETNLLRAVIKCESNFNKMAVSKAGAQGLMQLMPETARLVRVDDPFDAAQNLEGGTRYLAYLLEKFNNDKRLALAAYNAGEGAVRRHGGVPPFRETQNYVKAVLDHYTRYCNYGTGSDTISQEDIQSFMRNDGTLVFTNKPWKYRKASGWSGADER